MWRFINWSGRANNNDRAGSMFVGSALAVASRCFRKTNTGARTLPSRWCVHKSKMNSSQRTEPPRDAETQIKAALFSRAPLYPIHFVYLIFTWNESGTTQAQESHLFALNRQDRRENCPASRPCCCCYCIWVHCCEFSLVRDFVVHPNKPLGSLHPPMRARRFAKGPGSAT